MIIDCVSDLHGHYPKLFGGEILIIAGDVTQAHDAYELLKLEGWLAKYRKIYNKIILIGGNHDPILENGYLFSTDITYLCDSGVEFNGLKIWGSPYTRILKYWHPACKAFGVSSDMDLYKHWSKIPDDTNILITHCPPFGIRDRAECGEQCGSKSLGDKLRELKSLHLHVFGHIHEGYGSEYQYYNPERARDESSMPRGHISVNAAIMNAAYEPVNEPIRIHYNQFTHECHDCSFIYCNSDDFEKLPEKEGVPPCSAS